MIGGSRLADADPKAITLKITGTNYVVTVEGEKEPDKGTCTLDTSTNLRHMTLASTDSPNRGKTFLAIYEMKDARSLRVCYGLSGTEFPNEVKAPKRTPQVIASHYRA